MADLFDLAATTKIPNDEATYGYYVELSSAEDVGDFKRKISNAAKRLGFSDYMFLRLANSEYPGELHSMPPELIDAYNKEGLYEHDLVLQHPNNSARPIFRSTISEHVLTAPFVFEHTHCMRDIDELNRSFGYYEFYNVPAKAINGNNHVMLSVTQRGMTPVNLKDMAKKCITDLQLLCRAIDVVSTRKFPGQLLGEEKREARTITINPRPLLVLDMLANNDLNITQVANKLGINVLTANKHLQAARRAFGVKTNYAAIRQAILNKLIDLK